MQFIVLADGAPIEVGGRVIAHRQEPKGVLEITSAPKGALTVSVSLAQIGEFSFILAGLGLSLGLLPQEGMSLVLAGAIFSIALNPLLFGAIAPVRQWALKRSSLARRLEQQTAETADLKDQIAQLRAALATAVEALNAARNRR